MQKLRSKKQDIKNGNCEVEMGFGKLELLSKNGI